MANESIAQVPADITNSVALRRFLERLVEKLDVAFGYRGDDGYVSTSALSDATSSAAKSLTALTKDVDSATTSVAEIEKTTTALDARLAVVEEQTASTTGYAVTELRDLNEEGWPLYSYFTALGSEILNPPSVLVADDMYTVFSTVLPPYTQEIVILDNTGLSTKYIRAGITWAGVITNGWS